MNQHQRTAYDSTTSNALYLYATTDKVTNATLRDAIRERDEASGTMSAWVELNALVSYLRSRLAQSAIA